MQEVQYADTLAHLKKNLMKADEMMEDENGEYSMAYYPMTSYAEEGGNKGGGYPTRRMDGSRVSYARGRGRNARRDSMGRYSREGENGGMSNRGYSRGGNNVVDGLKELMYAAPQEMQGEIQRLIKKLDNM